MLLKKNQSVLVLSNYIIPFRKFTIDYEEFCIYIDKDSINTLMFKNITNCIVLVKDINFKINHFYNANSHVI